MAPIKEFSSADLNTISRLSGVSNVLVKVNGATVAASSFSGLLDTYTGAAAAYSVRQLRTGETISMRIRRDTAGGTGDDDEADVAFDTSLSTPTISLDSAISNASSGVTATTLGQFINVGTVSGTTYTNPDSLTVTAICFVDQWKDQSGNGNDAEQNTHGSQPQIHDGTVNTDLITENGKPAVHFDTAISHFRLSKIDTINTVFFVYTPGATMNRVMEIPNTASNKIVFHVGVASNTTTFVSFPDSVNNVVTSDAETSISGQSLVSSYDNSNSFLDGSAFTANGNGYFPKRTSYATIGIRGDGTRFGSIMHMQEVILYDTDHSSAHTTIETDINNYFSIY